MLLIDVRHGASTISLASRRNRLDTETFRRLAALPRVDHRRIGRLDVAGQARGIEQRVGEPALGQPLAQRDAIDFVTLFRRANNLVIARFRSRNGEALKVAEKFQGGGHANASGAVLPKSVRTISDAIVYLRQVLNPKKEAPLNSLENIFAEIDAERR